MSRASVRTRWCGASRVRKDCSPASRRAPRWPRSLEVARRLDRGMVVTVFPDGAEKYLTEKFWTGRCLTRVSRSPPGVAGAIRRHGEETYPHECCGALVGGDGSARRDRRAAEHDRGRAAATFSRAAVGLPAGGAAGRRSWRRAARVLSFASGPSGASVAVRSGSRVADVRVRDRRRSRQVPQQT